MIKKEVFHILLSKEQNKYGKWFAVLSVLIQDLQVKQYDNIYKLYIVANIDIADIINKTHQSRMYSRELNEQIFVDLSYALAEAVIKDEVLNSTFCDIYRQKYPSIYKHFLDIKESYYQEELQRKKLSFTIKEGQSYFKYLIYDSNLLLEAEDIWFGLNYLDDKSKCHEFFQTSEFDYVNRNTELYCFSGTNEPVLKSRLYKKHISRCKQRMADYLNIDVSQLTNYFHENIRTMADGNWGSGPFALMNNSLVESILIKNCSQWWLYGLIDDTQATAYYPDVDSIIEIYYRSFVITKYLEMIEKGYPFNKITLSRECRAESIIDDIKCVVQLYHGDLLIELLIRCMQQYYSNFSWERIARENTVQYYQSVIEELSSELFHKNKRIELLSEENSILKISNRGNVNSEIRCYEKEIDRLLRKLEQKESDISQLKKRLCDYAEFDSLNNTAENEMASTVNIELLQQYRYLIVGDFRDSLGSLVGLFPNSLFMESDTFDLQGIKCDAVVLLIKKMSHSMYYKIKSSSLYGKTPLILCNGTSKNSIISEMYKHIILWMQ